MSWYFYSTAVQREILYFLLQYIYLAAVTLLIQVFTMSTAVRSYIAADISIPKVHIIKYIRIFRLAPPQPYVVIKC